jgi:hypothetical protein
MIYSIHVENMKFLQNLSLRASREGSDHLENVCMDRRMILKWIIWKYGMRK